MVDETDSPTKLNQRRGIYLLPNLLTTAALFSGFYAIIASINDRFEAAAIAIFVAMILDGLDGRVARMTNTQSDFGAEYDSLADLVSFGLAPALVMYEWSLHALGKVGWSAAFLYTVFAALRLARFNTQVGKMDKAYFQGLASPAAAAVMSGFVWIGYDYQLDGTDLAPFALVITIVAGLLMVSRIRYHSFKELDLRGRVPFVTALIVVVIFVLIATNPPQILFLCFSLYLISGPILTLTQLRQRRALRRVGENPEQTPSEPKQD